MPSQSPGVVGLACGRSSTPGHRRTSSITFRANCSRSSDDNMQPSGVNDRSRRRGGTLDFSRGERHTLYLASPRHLLTPPCPMSRRPVLPLICLPFVLLAAAPRQVARSGCSGSQPNGGRAARAQRRVAQSVMWASGQRGTVLHTTDDADSWSYDTIPGASALDLRAIDATSAQVAHAISIGDSSRIYRTTDGGRTWSLRWSATRKGTFLDAIRFWDARNGIAMSDPVDGRFLILTTSGRRRELAGGAGRPHPAGARRRRRLRRERQLPHRVRRLARVVRERRRGGGARVPLARPRAHLDGARHADPRGRRLGRHLLHRLSRRSARRDRRRRLPAADAARTQPRAHDEWRPHVDARRQRSLAGRLPLGRRIRAGHGGPSSSSRWGVNGTDLSRDGGRTWTHVDTWRTTASASPRRRGWAVGPKGRIGRWGVNDER